MNRSPCTSDLVVRERRGLLTSRELMALDAHVAGCSTCRMARQIGLDFDRHAMSEIDDGDRVQRLMANARDWYGRRHPVRLVFRRRVRARTLVLFAASFVLLGGVAVAALGLSPLGARMALPSAAKSSTPAAMAPVVKSLGGEIPVIPAASEPSASVAVQAPLPALKSSRATARPTGLDESAAAIFRLASDARRDGDVASAKSLYRKLERAYPDSPEATMALVPLGGLLLDSGDAKGAVDQFGRYLQTPRAALKAEALYGEGRALSVLDDHAAERRVWTRLLDEFPTCPYATTARRRLAQLP